jgi:hypothetical protein
VGITGRQMFLRFPLGREVGAVEVSGIGARG